MLDTEDYDWAKVVLKKLDFFSHCSDEDIAVLVENMDKHHYKAGSTVLFQGEISNRFYVVQEGKVGIWKSVAGEKKMVADLGPEKYFGEISLMTPTSATATVKAETDADILSLVRKFGDRVPQKPRRLEKHPAEN